MNQSTIPFVRGWQEVDKLNLVGPVVGQEEEQAAVEELKKAQHEQEFRIKRFEAKRLNAFLPYVTDLVVCVRSSHVQQEMC